MGGGGGVGVKTRMTATVWKRGLLRKFTPVSYLSYEISVLFNRLCERVEKQTVNLQRHTEENETTRL